MNKSELTESISKKYEFLSKEDIEDSVKLIIECLSNSWPETDTKQRKKSAGCLSRKSLVTGVFITFLDTRNKRGEHPCAKRAKYIPV